MYSFSLPPTEYLEGCDVRREGMTTVYHLPLDPLALARGTAEWIDPDALY